MSGLTKGPNEYENVWKRRDVKVGNLKIEEIKSLPHFLIQDKFKRDDKFYLEGMFEPRHNLISTIGHMYVIQPPSFYQDSMFAVLWNEPDEPSQILEYYSNWDSNEIAVGKSLPCGLMNLRKLLLILDTDTVWESREFHISDALSFEIWPGVHGTIAPDDHLPKDAKNVNHVKNGWDHVHCTFCDASISENDKECNGFVAKNAFGVEEWVCRKCYETMIVPHRI